MTRYFRYGSCAALICSLSAPAAYADLTAQDVWQEWNNYLTSTGYDVTADTETSGDTLTVSNLKMMIPVPDEDTVVTLGIPSMALVENGDGTVNAIFPASLPISVEVEGSDTEELHAVVTMTHSNGKMLISGDPSQYTYVHSSDTLEFELTSLTIEDKPDASDAIKAKFSVNGSNGESTIGLGDMRSFTQDYKADSLSYDLTFSDPDSTDAGSFKGELSGLSMNGSGEMPTEFDNSDMAAMLAAGFKMKGNMSYSAGNSDIQGSGDGQEFSATTSSQGGSVAVQMDSTNIGYDLKSQNTTVAVTASELPFPVSLEMAQAALSFLLPVAKTEDPQDFSFAMNLQDFKMSDMLWNLFDPQGTLPRDPATVSIDTTGKATLAFDMLDPEAAMQMETIGTPPGELNEIDINNLLISMVGAKLEGQGNFTFDNSDLESFGGAPRPQGEMDLSLTGANGLLDKLIEMGFVSSQDAMGARMMMGMLAVPGEGPDSLKSKIEINEQGQILANGQRLK